MTRVNTQSHLTRTKKEKNTGILAISNHFSAFLQLLTRFKLSLSTYTASFSLELPGESFCRVGGGVINGWAGAQSEFKFKIQKFEFIFKISPGSRRLRLAVLRPCREGETTQHHIYPIRSWIGIRWLRFAVTYL